MSRSLRSLLELADVGDSLAALLALGSTSLADATQAADQLLNLLSGILPLQLMTHTGHPLARSTTLAYRDESNPYLSATTAVRPTAWASRFDGGASVQLCAYGGGYISVQSATTVVAGPSVAGDQETFRVVFRHGNVLALRGNNGRFLSVNADGGSVTCDATVVADWELLAVSTTQAPSPSPTPSRTAPRGVRQFDVTNHRDERLVVWMIDAATGALTRIGSLEATQTTRTTSLATGQIVDVVCVSTSEVTDWNARFPDLALDPDGEDAARSYTVRRRDDWLRGDAGGPVDHIVVA